MIRTLRPFDPHSIKLVIFDLDGTLIDSRLDLVHSVNAALRHIGRPELPDDVIASYVGDGAPILIQRALGDEATDEALVRKGSLQGLESWRDDCRGNLWDSVVPAGLSLDGIPAQR